MKVLVTGAGGFVGSHLCRDFRKHGIDVRAVVRPGTVPSPDRPLGEGVELVPCDLFSASATELVGLAEGVDVCVHSAWFAVPGAYLTSALNEACASGSQRFFEALGVAGCSRVVGVGTCLEYGFASAPLSETARLAPLTPYAQAKVRTFEAGTMWAREARAAFVWARLFHLFGEGEDSRRLVPSVALRLLRGEPAPVTQGAQLRDFLYVGDVASALVALALSSVEGAVNIGSGKAITVRHVVETVGMQLGRSDLIRFGGRTENRSEPRVLIADTGRLQTEVGWRPRHDLETGLHHTLAWWRERA